MCLNFYNYQFKISRYSCMSTHMNPMVTINQKPTIDTGNQNERKTQAYH